VDNATDAPVVLAQISKLGVRQPAFLALEKLSDTALLLEILTSQCAKASIRLL